MPNFTQNPAPVLRKETKVSHLTLFFLVTATTGTIDIDGLTGSELQLVRVLHGCKVH
jgi:hypothetical protein